MSSLALVPASKGQRESPSQQAAGRPLKAPHFLDAQQYRQPE